MTHPNSALLIHRFTGLAPASTRGRRAGLALAAGVLGGLLCACEVNTRPCSSRMDCFGHEECFQGRCAWIGPKSDGPGTRPDADVALDLASDTGQGCTHDNHCPPQRPECHNGQCVACDVDNEAEVCQGTSCDPSGHFCTSTAVRSLDVCEPCVADSECAIPDSRCVMTEYQGEPLESFCLQRAVDNTCSRPYVMGRDLAIFCYPASELTTCDAIQSYGALCEVDEECGPGGMCVLDRSKTKKKCTFQCTSPMECFPGRICTNTYCDL